MRIDFNVVLKNLDGDDLIERGGEATIKDALVLAGVSPMLLDHCIAAMRPFMGTGEIKERKLTLMRACAGALQQADPGLTGAQKMERIKLAIMIMDRKQPVDIDSDEKAEILKCVDKIHGPLIYARVAEVLENDPLQPERAAEPALTH